IANKIAVILAVLRFDKTNEIGTQQRTDINESCFRICSTRFPIRTTVITRHLDQTFRLVGTVDNRRRRKQRSHTVGLQDWEPHSMQLWREVNEVIPAQTLPIESRRL